MSELRPNTRAGGFTLVELMITIFVAAILVTLALPSFRETMIRSNVTGTINQLVSDVNLARSEAVHRGTMVAIISNSGGSDWSSGWYVETDGDFKADGTFSGNPPAATSKDALLRTNPGVNTSTGYSVHAAVTALAGVPGITPTNDKMIFNAQGNLIPRATSFDINVCRPDSKPTESKRINISSSGMIATQTNTAGSPAPGC